LKNIKIAKFIFSIAVIFLSIAFFALDGLANQEPKDDFLTKAERQWLAEHPSLRLGVGVSFPPYQWVERDQDGYVFNGVVSEYLDILGKRLNVELKIVYGIDFQQALALGKSHQIDLFPCLASTPERSEFLLFTNPYISYPSVIITREDGPVVGGLQDLGGRTIAAVKNQAIFSSLITQYAHLNLQILATENAEQDLEAVSFGRADACLMDLGVASYLIQKKRLTNLKVAAPSGLESINLAMGVRKDWPLLQTILQKTLDSLTREEKDAINRRWIQLQYEPGVPLGRIFRWTILIALGLGLILSGQYIWNRRLQREIRERKRIEQERNDLITELKRALAEVKTLQGFLPICAGCRKIRNDTGYWQQIECYIEDHTDTKFSHGLCPDCAQELYPEIAPKILKKQGGAPVGKGNVP